MAYREVTLLEVKEVLRLWLRGRPIRAIARSAGVNRNTVRSYIAVAAACGLSAAGGEAELSEEKLSEVLLRLKTRPRPARGKSWAKCEEGREFLEKKLAQGLKLSKVRRLLERTGVTVPYPTLHRYAVSELGFGGASATIPVSDCEPGEELQVDTGWVGHLEPDGDGRRRRFRAWIFTAVRSRHRFVYPCLRETTETAIEACEATWEFFGGIFRVLIPDNTKVVVRQYDPLQPRITATFLEYAQKRGFEIDPTRRRSPQDKGRVERAVIPTQDDCFAGEVLPDLEAARRRARVWCLQEYGMRRHTRTQRLPLEHFEAEEKAALAPAPSEPYDIPQWSDPKIARDQHAQVSRALYSVPREFEGRKLVGRYLRARSDRSLVRFYFEGVLVKMHPRQAPGGRSTDPADFPPEKMAYALRDIDFIGEQAALHGEEVGAFARALLAGPLPWTRMRRVYSVIGLCKRYGDGRVNEACAVARKVDMLDVRRLGRMLALASPAPPPGSASPEKVIAVSRFLRPSRHYVLTPAATRRNEKEGQ